MDFSTDSGRVEKVVLADNGIAFCMAESIPGSAQCKLFKGRKGPRIIPPFSHHSVAKYRSEDQLSLITSFQGYRIRLVSPPSPPLSSLTPADIVSIASGFFLLKKKEKKERP